MVFTATNPAARWGGITVEFPVSYNYNPRSHPQERLVYRILFLLGAIVSAPASAQQLRGKVLGDGGPLDGVTITMLTMSGQLIASGITIPPDGSFQLAAPVGTYDLRFERIGYAVHVQRLVLAGDTTFPPLRLRAQSIGLEGMNVPISTDQRGVGRRLDRVRLDSLEARGWSVVQALRQIPDVMVRNVDDTICIESALRIIPPGRVKPPCDPVLIVIDGSAATDASALAELSLSGIDQIEYVPPKEAAARYGEAAARQGALIIRKAK